MNCREGVGQLMEYTEGTLPRAQRGALEAHVHGCVRCRKFVASYRATVRLMRQETADRLQASNDDAQFELTLCS